MGRDDKEASFVIRECKLKPLYASQMGRNRSLKILSIVGDIQELECPYTPGGEYTPVQLFLESVGHCLEKLQIDLPLTQQFIIAWSSDSQTFWFLILLNITEGPPGWLSR